LRTVSPIAHRDLAPRLSHIAFGQVKKKKNSQIISCWQIIKAASHILAIPCARQTQNSDFGRFGYAKLQANRVSFIALWSFSEIIGLNREPNFSTFVDVI